jgi:hypothetical protein
MCKRSHRLLFFVLAAATALAAGKGKNFRQGSTNTAENITEPEVRVSCIQEGKRTTPEGESAARRCILWDNPADIASRNLLYGPGGPEHEPRGTFTFVNEDLDGTNPKIVVRDAQGVRWKVKMGQETRPETVASRFVWAAGYYANEDYLEPRIFVYQMPEHLKRGQKFVEHGWLHNVRLKRYLDGEKKAGEWPWSESSFANTREFNGLRVLMALITNWDLKDENNAVYLEKGRDSEPSVYRFTTSDLGATFATAIPYWPQSKSKGNMNSYRKAKFIIRMDANRVDFATPGRPPRVYALFHPHDYHDRRNLAWIGLDIPREDARWLGGILARLSPQQIRDAFRSGGYCESDVEGYAKAVEHRIADLTAL